MHKAGLKLGNGDRVRIGAVQVNVVLCPKRDLSSETEIAAGSVRCWRMLFGARSGT